MTIASERREIREEPRRTLPSFVRLLELSASERQSISMLAEEVSAKHASVEDSEFLSQARLYCHELPFTLRSALYDFALRESSQVLVLAGCPVNDRGIGPTPKHWKDRPQVSPCLSEEIVLVLLGSLLGEAVAWATQQDGYLVHDILPVKAHENEQLGSGSKELLWWHIEDAFHEHRGDYVGMLCLRNPDRVATTVGTLNVSSVEPHLIDVLFQQRFIIRPDESHRIKNRAKPDDDRLDALVRASHQRIESAICSPSKVAVLFGDREAPYLRLDPYFMTGLDDAEAQAALEALVGSIEASLFDLALRPGDCCFIDNFRAVHGRRSFTARYDGADRWLKRVNIVRDLRRSRSLRRFAESRVLY